MTQGYFISDILCDTVFSTYIVSSVVVLIFLLICYRKFTVILRFFLFTLETRHYFFISLFSRWGTQQQSKQIDGKKEEITGSAGQGGGRRHTDVCQGRQRSHVLSDAPNLFGYLLGVLSVSCEGKVGKRSQGGSIPLDPGLVISVSVYFSLELHPKKCGESE